MIKAIVSDLSITLLQPIDKDFTGSLNAFHEQHKDAPEYDIWKYFQLNEDLLSYYSTLKDEYAMYLFTTRYIQEWPPLKKKLETVFTTMFSGDQMDVTKDVPSSYLDIAAAMCYSPAEVLYIDDRKINTEAAAKSGMKTILFESEPQAIQDIRNVLEK